MLLASAALPSATVAPPPPMVAVWEAADAAAGVLDLRPGGLRGAVGCVSACGAHLSARRSWGCVGRERSEGVCGRLLFLCFSCRFISAESLKIIVNHRKIIK